jgi:hypothetical protein
MAIQTFTSGQILTAAQMTALQAQAVMTFTTEAARDAAITAPTEGMVAYLTAPTVPAATGTVTMLPTGIVTIYNGSAWVCVSSVGAYTSASGTTTSASYTATLSGSPGTNPSVTLTTGTTALVTIGSYQTGSASNGEYATGFAVSGASTIVANFGRAFYMLGVANMSLNGCNTILLDGLTAGTNTFTLNYQANGGTGTFQQRRITVSGCL